MIPPLREVIVVSIGIWYLTRVIMYSDGPKQILFHIRRLLGRYGPAPPGSLGDMLKCFFCTSFWISIPIILFLQYDFWYVPIFCGLATIIDRGMVANQWVEDTD